MFCLRKERFASIIDTVTTWSSGRIEFSDVENTRERVDSSSASQAADDYKRRTVSSGARILAALTRPRTSNSARASTRRNRTLPLQRLCAMVERGCRIRSIPE